MKITTTPWINLGARFPFLYDLKRTLARSKFFSNILFRRWFYKMNTLSFEGWKLDREMATQRDLHISAHKALQDICTLDLSTELLGIKNPILAISGIQDSSVPASESKLIHDFAPASRLCMIDRCGHYPMYEQRDVYLDAILSFLRQAETLDDF